MFASIGSKENVIELFPAATVKILQNWQYLHDRTLLQELKSLVSKVLSFSEILWKQILVLS